MDGQKHIKTLDDERTKALKPPSVGFIFLKCRKTFLSLLPKKVYQVSMRLNRKSSRRKPAKHKKTSREKVSKPCSVVPSKKNDLEEKK